MRICVARPRRGGAYLALTVAVLWLAGLAACGASDPPAAPTPPNVIILLADDQGWGDLSLHGNTAVSTPHIDSLATDGAQFERFFVQPLCAPTRADLLTGRYFPRGGVTGVSTGAERLDPEARTMADVFRAAGYATATFGKWHNGTQAPYHPNARGFDEFYGFTSGHWAHYFDPPLDHNGTPVTGRGYLPDDLTTRALQFLESRGTQPVFVLLSYNTPHSPMQVPDAYWDRVQARTLPPHRYSAEEDEPHTRAALAMVENLDDNVGRLLHGLEQLGLASDTIVVYLTDNGPNGWRWNGDMKGRKGTLDEGGVRSPLLVRWPGRIDAGRRVPQIAGAIDLLPTLADLADVDVPVSPALDGVSLAPLLTGDPPRDWPARAIYAFATNGRDVSVRTQQYRLDAQGALFDMDADPGQRQDIAPAHADLAASLRAEAARLAEAIGFGAGGAPRPFTVGYAERTSLPARDGVPHGGIARSSRHPNDSYFLNWRSTSDAVTWDIEVATAGDYEVEVLYAVPPGDEGASVRLTFGDATLDAHVTDAHDPPLIGEAHDRTPRTESYTKVFRALPLGRMRLEAQRGELRLTAPVIPGQQAWEVAGLELIRSGRVITVDRTDFSAYRRNGRELVPVVAPPERSAGRGTT